MLVDNMKMLHKLYGLILLFIFSGCGDYAELGEPVVIKEHFDTESEYIVLVGDIQEYTYNEYLAPYLDYTMRWLYLAKDMGVNIKSVLLTGDITSENTREEWDTFFGYAAPVARKLPFVSCIGNHDYAWNEVSEILDRNETLFSNYMTIYNAKAEVLARYEENRMENIVVKNRIFGEIYDILVLEFGPRSEVIEWANKYVSSNPDKKYILLTHEFLSSDGSIISVGSYAERQFRNTTKSSPKQLWDSLITCNDNIACVVCGHNGFSRLNHMKNDFGRDVPQILFNIQYQENGGNGMVEIWEMKQNSDSISVGIYNTISNEWIDMPDTAFKFRYRY